MFLLLGLFQRGLSAVGPEERAHQTDVVTAALEPQQASVLPGPAWRSPQGGGEQDNLNASSVSDVRMSSTPAGCSDGIDILLTMTFCIHFGDFLNIALKYFETQIWKFFVCLCCFAHPSLGPDLVLTTTEQGRQL